MDKLSGRNVTLCIQGEDGEWHPIVPREGYKIVKVDIPIKFKGSYEHSYLVRRSLIDGEDDIYYIPIAKAGVPDRNNDIFSDGCLRSIAENSIPEMFIYYEGTLYYNPKHK